MAMIYKTNWNLWLALCVLMAWHRSFHRNSNSTEISFHSQLDSKAVIATKFAHDTTAVLSWHVQKLLRSDGQQRSYGKAKFPSNLNFGQKTVSETDPRYHLEHPYQFIAPEQNGHHFTDDILKSMLVNEIFCNLFKISLKFVPKFLIDNNPALD